VPANFNGGIHPGKTRATWPFCDISYGGQELQIQPYETLVAGWTDDANGAVPADAYPFGTDGPPGGPALYPCRAYVNGQGFQIGKVRPGLGCLIPLFGQEVPVTNYQVLTKSLPMTTQRVVSFGAPANSIVGGYDLDGTPLYLCQASFGGGLVPGKTRPPWNSCDVGWGGTEHFVDTYYVLVPAFSRTYYVDTNTYDTAGVFSAGNEADGTKLGACRHAYQNSIQVGKFLPDSFDGLCDFGFAGVEVALPEEFDVLSF